MSSGILSIYNPSEEKQQLAITKTIANSEDKKLVEYLSSLQNSTEEANNQNEAIRVIFSIDKDIIRDCCSIMIEEDLKKCFISPISTDNKRKDILLSATNFALNTLGVQDVYVSTNAEGNSTSFFEQNGYEYVGEVNGSDCFLKIKDDNKDLGRIVM